MARPKRDNELAAKALVNAVLQDDAKACKKHNIARRTLQNYRKALIDDAELSRVFTSHLNEATRRAWGDELAATMTDMLVSIKATIASLESQTTSFDEHMQVLSMKLEFLKLMLEPAVTLEVLVSSTQD